MSSIHELSKLHETLVVSSIHEVMKYFDGTLEVL